VKAAAIVAFVVAIPLGAQAVTPLQPTRDSVIAVAREIMHGARYASMVTIGPDGHPQARIVDPFAPASDLTVWIGTNALTRKVSELRRDPRVTLLYFNAVDGEYVTVVGVAALVADSASRAQHWKEEWAAFYAGGPLDTNYLLVRVTPIRLEVVSPRRGILNDAVTWRPVSVSVP